MDEVYKVKKDVRVHWAWDCDNKTICQIAPGSKLRRGTPIKFDQVFNTAAKNRTIFAKLIQPLIEDAVKGFNATVFAYGQTASGRTHTMIGSQKEPGNVQLVVEIFFNFD